MKQISDLREPSPLNAQRALWPVLKRLPIYLRLAWNLASEPSIALQHKIPIYLAAIYVVSPAHLILSPVPVLGQIDGLIAVLFSVRQMVINCPQHVLSRSLIRVGLSREQLDADLDAVNKAGGTAVSQAFRKTVGNAKFVGRIIGGVGIRSLARLVVALEKPPNRQTPGG